MAFSFRQESPWSLKKPEHLFWLLLGTSLGIGNILVFPKFVLGGGGALAVFVHLLGLVLLGGPLAFAELVWGRWQLRPYVETLAHPSYRIYRILLLVSALSLVFFLPEYFSTLSKIILEMGIDFYIPFRKQLAVESLVDRIPTLESSFALLSLLCLLLLLNFRTLVSLIRFGVIFCFSVWIYIAALVLYRWGGAGLWQFLDFNFQMWSPLLVLQILGFSLFSLSVGVGLFFNASFFASLMSQKGALANESFWSDSRNLRSIVLKVLFCDFLLTLLVLIWLSPFAASVNSKNSFANIPVETLVFDWLPIVFRSLDESRFLEYSFFFSMLVAGSIAILMLLNFLAFGSQTLFKWTRSRSLLGVFVVIGVLLLLLLTPVLPKGLESISIYFLWPLSMGGVALFVSRNIPLNTLKKHFGSSLLLDALFPYWVRFLKLVPLSVLLFILGSLLHFIVT